ncbi:hypothetical protein K1W69_04745 [Hoeflea sp. WL0058]|uniref:Uncharacterized protein n=1 Tax=Flavimaribacter sediminis TaxID=2865987 RepID=A0AAE2ZL37_9HYPH|nr:hypothetical protein [Flavimaribacter sediminis]MBW8636490.1 hypothetical protein [Flavimaribacter sediminis]
MDRRNRQPSIGALAIGSLLWGTAMAVTVLIDLRFWLDGHTLNTNGLVALYFAGGLAGFSPARLIARRIAAEKPFTARVSASFLCLVILTIAATAIVFAISFQYSNGYYHPSAIGWMWPFYIAASGIAASFQFLVMGSRYFLPTGIPLLALASYALAKALR